MSTENFEDQETPWARSAEIQTRLKALGFSMEYDFGSMPGEGHLLLAASGEVIEPTRATPAEVMQLAKEWSDLADSMSTDSDTDRSRPS